MNSSQNVMSYPKHRGAKYSPFAFIALRQFALSCKELAEKIAELEKKYNKQFVEVYEVIKLLQQKKQTLEEWENRQLIGYIQSSSPG